MVEAMSLRRRKWPVHSKAVELAWGDAENIAVPYKIRVGGKFEPHGLDRVIGSVEQAEFHGRCMFGEDGEIDAFSIPGGTERTRIPGKCASIPIGGRCGLDAYEFVTVTQQNWLAGAHYVVTPVFAARS